jgi:hypothetical protein
MCGIRHVAKERNCALEVQGLVCNYDYTVVAGDND